MKKILLISTLIICTCLQAQIVNIPDPNFKNALINTPCVIFGPPGDCGDVNASVDINGDGEVQVIEAEAVDLLCIGFQNITSLEGIEAFTNLERLFVWYNDLTSIDTSHNLLLKTLNCNSNNLTSINTNTTLEVLNVNNNELTTLDISNNSSLISLNCSNNQLSSIDISYNAQLKSLTIVNNELTAIDLSQNPNFAGLNIKYNYLTSIDLSHNPLLRGLLIDGNALSSFDVSNNPLLVLLSFSDSPLITGDIDLSQHPVLRDLRCENTSISGLNIKNGYTQLLNHLKAYYNPNLFCIEVDDAEAANAGVTIPYSNWQVHPQVTFSEDCLLGVEEHAITTLVLSPNPVKDSFTITTKLEVLSLKIFNLQGKLLYQEVNPNHTLTISNLASGVLFLQFTTDVGVITKKVVKK